MTLLSLLLSFFPTTVVLLAIATLAWLWVAPSAIAVATILFVLYGLPLCAYHLHNLLYPLIEGTSYLRGTAYSPWWGSHQIQQIYIAIPILETVLRLIPGMFSLWLKLWGAKVGRGVYWTPAIEIADRGLLNIGDRVVFGYRVGIYSHVVKPKQNNLLLYVKPIEIGSDSFVGAGSVLGPGTVLPKGSYLPVESRLSVNQVIATTAQKFPQDSATNQSSRLAETIHLRRR
ncbi:MAG: acyl transferase [Cyanobacteria bacterium P01_E01_bin.34]